MIEDMVDVSLDPGLEPSIIEQERERDGAVEPVGGTLPALGLAADPGAVLDVGPELVEVAAQSLGLEPELSLQPARRPDRPEWQLGERRGLEGGRGPRLRV